MDITELILADHHEQRRAFARLDDVALDDTESLRLLWGDLAHFLEVHAAAEEAVFYPELLRLADTGGEETKDAIGDHNDIRDGILASREHDPGTEGWWAGVTAARKANDEHMGEEEHEGLADFRRYVDLDTRHRIAVPFVAYEATNVDGVPVVDKDPDTYIKENS